ncbi:tellurite resistance TerB family protein [Synechococcus sp. CBW1006]|uniref:tellurite resistance TerB family protein n=1 Tax=unclassified Synechococcus TaxID=2626047 RepID=UPI00351C3553
MEQTSPDFSMDSPTALAAVALAAVSWDGSLTRAGTRSLRHLLDYRAPYNQRSEAQMIALMDDLLAELRRLGAEGLMERAASVLDPRQRHTAYAMAAEIMRSDGPLLEQEQLILEHLAETLSIDLLETAKVLEVMDILHAALDDPNWLTPTDGTLRTTDKPVATVAV